MKKIHKKDEVRPRWNLGLLYKSVTDPAIEKDMKGLEMLCDSFAAKYDQPKKDYLENEEALLGAMEDYETLIVKLDAKPLIYFSFLRDIEADNSIATAQIALLQNRLAKCLNTIAFFQISLGTISAQIQKHFLSSAKLKHYHVYLSRRFSDAKYTLSLAEEKIINLKSQPAYDMWLSGNDKLLNMKTVAWKNKELPIAGALNLVQQLDSQKDRNALAKVVAEVLKTVAPFSEAEINAVVTNKKIDDELRGYGKPFESTVRGYRNDPRVVEHLVQVVTDSFHIAHRFYKLKAKLLKLKKLSYPDRAAKIGVIKTKFPFNNSVEILKKTFGGINPRFATILDTYIANGQIDVPSRVGKSGGAYCAGNYEHPTFVMLNHLDDFHSFNTFAHEMGHAFHTELSKCQGPIYHSYSTALAETASTLFESIAADAIYESLSDKEKIIVLHDRINDSVATIFRQIACFNFENEIHNTIRSKGFMSKEELADAHNKNMSAYLGPIFKLNRDDGYMFVHWSHIRRFFYVYSYAFGLLVSKALLRRYRADKSFWASIEKFLSAGGRDSPENILKEIGIDISKPDFWESGLREIEEDIDKLENLTRK